MQLPQQLSTSQPNQLHQQIVHPQQHLPQHLPQQLQHVPAGQQRCLFRQKKFVISVSFFIRLLCSFIFLLSMCFNLFFFLTPSSLYILVLCVFFFWLFVTLMLFVHSFNILFVFVCLSSFLPFTTMQHHTHTHTHA